MSKINNGDIIEILLKKTNENVIVNVIDAYDGFIIILKGFWLVNSEFEYIRTIRTSNDVIEDLSKVKKNDDIEIEYIDYSYRDDANHLVLNFDFLKRKKITSNVLKKWGNYIYINGEKLSSNNIISIKKVS